MAPLAGGGPRRRSRARRQPAAERVAAALRAAMREGSLRGGVQVNQERWADHLDVSRAALREGLKLLTAEKLLVHEAHRGYFVAAFGLTEMQEIYWLRVQVEREVLLSCRVPDEGEAAELTAAYEASIVAAEAGDRPARFAAERLLFFGIYALSPHRFLRSEAMRLWDLAETYRSIAAGLPPPGGPSLASVKERRRLQLDAVVSGDRFSLAESVLGERRWMVVYLTRDAEDSSASESLSALRWS